MKILEKLKQMKPQIYEALTAIICWLAALFLIVGGVVFVGDYCVANAVKNTPPKKEVIQCIITEGEKITNVWIELFPNESMIDRYQFLIDGCGNQCKVVRCDSVESFPTK